MKGRRAVKKDGAGTGIGEEVLFLDGGEGVGIQVEVAIGSDAMCEEWAGRRRELGVWERNGWLFGYYASHIRIGMFGVRMWFDDDGDKIRQIVRYSYASTTVCSRCKWFIVLNII